VKKAVFRAESGKEGGFIRTMLAPVNDKREPRFSWFDLAMLLALIIGAVFLARLVLTS